MKQIISFAFLLCCGSANGQLYLEKDAVLFLTKGSSIHVPADITAYNEISGEGLLVLDGEQVQTVNMNGYGISNIEVRNTRGIELAGNISIFHSLLLSGGNINLGSYQLEMSGVTKAGSTANFGIESSEHGVVRINVNEDLTNFSIPYVSRGIYTPLAISSKGRYSNAYLEISSGNFQGNLPADVSDHFDHAWKITRSGIDGYVHAGIDVSRFVTSYGSIAPMLLYFRNGKEWNLIDGAVKTAIMKKGTVGPTGTEFLLMKRNGSGLGISLSPNPVNDVARINLFATGSGRAVFKIMDSRGNIVRAQPVQIFNGRNIFNVNVAGLASGTYHAVLLLNGRTSTIKFIRD